MGQLAASAHGASFEMDAPQAMGSDRSARVAADAPDTPAGADSEVRRVLSLLRVAMDRLPE